MLASLLAIHYKGSTMETHTSMLDHIGEGIDYARRHGEIMSLMLVSFAVSAFANGVVYNLSPYWLPEVLHASAFTWGLTAAVWGFGAIGVAYGLSFRGDYRNKGWLFLAGSLGGSSLLIAWALVRDPVLFGVIQFFMGGLLNATVVAGAAIIQTRAPNEVRGRLMSLFWLNPAFMMLNGLFIGGLAEAVGAETAALGIGIGLTAALAAAVLALPRLRHVH